MAETFAGTDEPDCFEWYADGVGMVKTYIRSPIVSISGEAEMAVWTEELVRKNF